MSAKRFSYRECAEFFASHILGKVNIYQDCGSWVADVVGGDGQALYEKLLDSLILELERTHGVEALGQASHPWERTYFCLTLDRYYRDTPAEVFAAEAEAERRAESAWLRAAEYSAAGQADLDREFSGRW